MTTSSAPPLQVLSEAAAAAWLVQWSGVVGSLSARTAAPHCQARRGRIRGSKDKAVPGPSTKAWEGRAAPRCIKSGGAALKREEAALGGTTATQPQLRGPPWRAGGRDSPTLPHPGCRTAPPSSVPVSLDGAILSLNVTRCAAFLGTHLPPQLLEGVLDTAWRTLSEEVRLGGREVSVPEHQAEAWARRAPAVLGVAARLCGTNTKYPLDLTGLEGAALRDVLALLTDHCPAQRLSALLLPKRKAARGAAVVEGGVLGRLLHRAGLASLTLSLDAVGGSGVLHELSRLSLQELDVSGGGRLSEAEVLQGLCGLPFTASAQLVEAVQVGSLGGLAVAPLRDSLRSLSVSLPGLSSAAYHAFLAVFHNLHHYSPACGAMSCVSGYARMAGPSSATTPLSLASLKLGRASRHDVLEAARLCPSLRDVSLTLELDSEAPLAALCTLQSVSGVQLSYFPASVSAQPRAAGTVLLPLLDRLGQQLVSLGLAGFSLGGGVVAALARLPELRRLSLTDCWLTPPDTAPPRPFPSLESLALSFMPPPDALPLFTAGGCLQSLDISMAASEARGAALTDAGVRQLVACGVLASIHTFNSASPFLSLASLRCLAALPRLRTVGRLARWGLTQEELRCVGHSGPPHLLCRH